METNVKTKRIRSGKFSRREVLETLKANKGGVYATASQLGCHYSTIYNYANRYPEIKAVLDDARHVILDKAELRIVELMDSDNEAVALKACMFTLETIGKQRGYTKQHEAVVSGKIETIDSEVLKQRILLRATNEAIAIAQLPSNE